MSERLTTKDKLISAGLEYHHAIIGDKSKAIDKLAQFEDFMEEMGFEDLQSLSMVIKQDFRRKLKGERNMKKEKYYIVRGDRSGVFAGNIKERNGREVLMKNVRRLWYWDGANSISQLAQEGTLSPNNCKFSVTVDEILVLDAIEIDTCTNVAEKSIKGVKVWKY